MKDRVYLEGTEAVTRAAMTIASATEDFSRNIGYLSDIFQRHEQFMDDWLARYHEEKING